MAFTRRSRVFVALGLLASTAAACGPATEGPASGPGTSARHTAHPVIDLTFSGDIKGHVSKASDVLPFKTGAHYDYASPDYSTQCVFPTDDGAWTANIGFRLNKVAWEIAIAAPDFGLPKAGRHPAVWETDAGGSNDVPHAVSIDIGSSKGPNGESPADGDEFTYYTPQEHDGGDGTVTINPSLTSGTVDIWLTPAEPENVEFHITGRWSCG